MQSDTALNVFFEACLANPDQCPLAQDGSSAEDLSQKFYQLLDSLKYYPYVINNDPVTGLVDYESIKQPFFGSLYFPKYWQMIGGALHALLTDDVASPDLQFLLSGGTLANDATLGIQCGDTTLRSNNLTEIRPLVDAAVDSSRIAGEIFASSLEPLGCAPWRFVAKERYSGNFQAQTKNPILLVGGPFDPITPLVSAYNTSAGFEGSVVLQHNGYGVSFSGHSSQLDCWLI